MSFIEATRRQSFLKPAIAGPAGSGKSFTGLRGLFALKRRGLVTRIAVITSEGTKIHKEARRLVDGERWAFQVKTLTSYAPAVYVEAIAEALRLGFDGILVDSISAEWQGTGGALEIVDKMESRNKFAGWKIVTPLHNRFIDAILLAPAHIIATVRLKQGYVMQAEERAGKTIQVPVRVGMEPIQRSGIEYEFEIYLTMDRSHIATVEKTICPAIDGATYVCPGDDLFMPIADWLSEGDEIDHAQYAAPRQESAALNELLERAIAAGLDMDDERAFIRRRWGTDVFVDLTTEQVAMYTKRVDQAETVARRQASDRELAATCGSTLQEAVATQAAMPTVPHREGDAIPTWCEPIPWRFESWFHLARNIPDEQKGAIFAGLLTRFGGTGATLAVLRIDQAEAMDAFLVGAIERIKHTEALARAQPAQQTAADASAA